MKVFFFSIIFLFPCFIYAQYKIKFEIKDSSSTNHSNKIFIAGNFNNWDPSVEENSFNADKNGAAKYELELPPGNYQYKFTKGSWDNVECSEDGSDIENRMLSLVSDTTIYVLIKGWKNGAKKHIVSANVYILDSAFIIPQLKRTRRIWIYLPADYKKTTERFPVIYMQDGQNLFDAATSGFGEWGIDEYLDSLFAHGKRESIIVGIDNGGDTRLNEYSPYDFKLTDTSTQKIKVEGNAYVSFLVKTLKPYIDRHFHTLSDKQNTFIAGSSVGAIISLYAVLKYPKVFGGAGIFSPAFWTAAGIDKDIKLDASKVNAKLFFYAGATESETMLPYTKRIELAIKHLSKSSIKEIIDPVAKHNEAAWRKYFPDFYQWIFGIE